ncbi:hypothetical protein VCSRO111_0605 [Vibrio cholerae]|uniref:hypothetical protein n=1 Tax=Vibrio cholerae TaxID=666 RepID=UPI0011D8FA77|nr:hypothetical protein [Vibrio cholerae]TXY57636.1 hypothetical protein FXE91_10780 [Vibrio cholerae]GHX89541.1 hypothetical protein VCSRO111_0605 [Vibrio cholerae]
MNLKQWKANKKLQSRINYGTQIGRVIRVMTEYGGWYTLREIEKMIAARYQDKDTQAAISARLREISAIKHGLVKHRRMEMVNGKQVHRYKLVPFVPVRSVADSVGVTA